MKLSDHHPIHFTETAIEKFHPQAWKLTALTTKKASPFNVKQAGLYIRLALNVRKQRNQLSTLSAAHLEDIGITPQAAAHEASRSFWDIPEQQLDGILTAQRGGE